MSEAMTPLAPPIRVRLGARVIDYVLLVAAAGALGQYIGYGFGWLAIAAPSVYAYFVVGDAFFGATLGKALFKLRVQDARGARPTIKEACLREVFVLFGAIPFVGPLLALAAWLTMAWTIRTSALGQGWHDRLAGGTRVTRR